jgi:pyruvate/2-oxoacid:ferredoxin oxidoreductase beta subunit
MDSLLNQNRPPVFCPGCSHERVVTALDKAFVNMKLSGNQIALVSDIGCSGLFDTFFHTHAFHGLHGRALTYATGIKMVQPGLRVIATMGDGGLGIGGAHFVSSCRRNLDITLLILNNFNYGMTGGQCSVTTPPESQVSSGFLNQLEKSLDVCQLAGSAGAGRVGRVSVYQKDLPEQLEAAIRFDGFSVLDIWGICPGRYTQKNRLTPKIIDSDMAQLPPVDGFSNVNRRQEYGSHYREVAKLQRPVQEPLRIPVQFDTPETDRIEVVILGNAGQRIVTAGEILCLAGITAGLHASQKNDYPITVLRGHSISEILLSNKAIGYTGIKNPSLVIALGQEGVNRRASMFSHLPQKSVIFKAQEVKLPPCKSKVKSIDFKSQKIRPADWALAALTRVTREHPMLNRDMLKAALQIRFKDDAYDSALDLVDRIGAV